jgi:tetraacyldisaccharide 4'-kinase
MSPSSDSIATRLEKSWWQSVGFLSLLLLPLAWLYAAITALRKLAFSAGLRKTYRAKVPVIVVGNFTVGGTGKTPVVIALTQALQANGYIPAIVSRGFRRYNARNLVVTHDSMPADVGDEPLLMKLSTKAAVAVASKRAEAIKLIENEATVIISDDGLQHLAMARDIEIVVTDSRREGNGLRLPAGPLREKPRAVDAVLVTSGTVREGEWPVTQHLGEAELASDRSVKRALSSFTIDAKIRCAAVAGIGAPNKFFEALRAQGIKLAHTASLPDHFDYANNPFTALRESVIFITEKDAIKCAHLDERLWVVPLVVTLPDALIAQLTTRLKLISTQK